MELLNVKSLKLCPLSNTDYGCFKGIHFYWLLTKRDAWSSNEKNTDFHSQVLSAAGVTCTRCPSANCTVSINFSFRW